MRDDKRIDTELADTIKNNTPEDLAHLAHKLRIWALQIEQNLSGAAPTTDTATMKKRAVSMALRKQLKADLHYCQSEGVDVAAFIKSKYKV